MELNSPQQDPSNWQAIDYKHDVYGRRSEKKVDGYGNWGGALTCEVQQGRISGDKLLSGDIYEQALVKPVMSLSKGRSRDFFTGIPNIYSASPD